MSEPEERCAFAFEGGEFCGAPRSHHFDGSEPYLPGDLDIHHAFVPWKKGIDDCGPAPGCAACGTESGTCNGEGHCEDPIHYAAHHVLLAAKDAELARVAEERDALFEAARVAYGEIDERDGSHWTSDVFESLDRWRSFNAATKGALARMESSK